MLALRIVTPWTSVISRGDIAASITVVPPPGQGRAIEFDILLVDQTTPVSGWPGKNKQNTKLVGSYALPNGTSVWVIWSEVNMPNLGTHRGTPMFYRGSSFDDLKADELRMLMFGDEPDGSKVIYDCVGKYEQGDT